MYEVEARIILRLNDDEEHESLFRLQSALHREFGEEKVVSMFMQDPTWGRYQDARDAYEDSIWFKAREAATVVFYFVIWLFIWPFFFSNKTKEPRSEDFFEVDNPKGPTPKE